MSKPLRVLIVEDSEDDALLLKMHIQRAGYDVMFERVDTAAALEKALNDKVWDIIISDYALPGYNGLSALMLVREKGIDVPFIIVSGTVGEDIAVETMKAGAHDYVMKMNMMRLVPAIERELREAQVRRERRQAEEALKASKERYQVLYEYNPSMYFTVDASGILRSVNLFGAAQLGYTVQELEGQPVMEMVYQDDRDAVKHHLQTSLQNPGKVMHWEFRKVRKDGAVIWVEELARTVTDKDGHPGVFIVCQDITERKQAEKERQRLESQLIQAQKMESVGLLAGGIAHDFNNLLTPIIGFAELFLNETAENGSQRQGLQTIKHAAERARDLTRQLLAFSRKQVLELKTVNPKDILDRFMDIMQRTIREDIKMEIITAPDLDTVCADVGQIEQVLMNLAVNAQDAMPSGGRLFIEAKNVVLDESFASRHHDVNPGRFVMLSVSDTGLGMDNETRERLFEPFYTTKDRGKGTGLGLSTVYGIVRQHGGIILISSEKGRGSTFEIYLPCIQDSREAVPLEKDLSMPLAFARKGETILVVDDDEMVLNTACEMLRKLGYEVIPARSADICFRIVESYRGRVDLLLTDVVLTEMDGRRIYSRLCGRWEGLKVLYMSGYTSDVIVHRGILESGVHFIPKPLTLLALSAKIRSVLDS